ncbi:hypothetical protein [Nocardia wallacei]|uniref:hypothetical protein n=1 Tax=Nocardia wallacei TaxID=480035 RepID=UPI00245581CC|nr:hypothetical protein [Nocardia wallacei]
MTMNRIIIAATVASILSSVGVAGQASADTYGPFGNVEECVGQRRDNEHRHLLPGRLRRLVLHPLDAATAEGTNMTKRIAVLLSAAAAVGALIAGGGTANADEGPYASYPTKEHCVRGADSYNQMQQERGYKTLRVIRDCYPAYGRWWFDARY